MFYLELLIGNTAVGSRLYALDVLPKNFKNQCYLYHSYQGSWE